MSNEAYKMEDPKTVGREPRRFHFPESTKDYIRTNFKIRECYKYRENSKDLCVCNKELIEHRDTSNSKEKWSYANNTVIKPCDNFGFINFSGYDYTPRGHYPKFIRFDCLENCDKTCESVYNLLTKHKPWNMATPKLIISMNGGLKKMKSISNQQKKNFKQGLIDVIKKDQTWVLGSGFNVGIHKLVSETINEFRLQQEDMKDQVSLIGISTWGVVFNNNRLTASQAVDGTNLNRHNYFKYENVLCTIRKKVTLDALYDNLLFCDDGTEKQYDKELDFKLKFENYIKKETDGFLVQILFEGGRRAIRNAYNSLQDKVPLVVIKGSGRAANIISATIELPNKSLMENITNIVNEHKDLLDIPKDDNAEADIKYLESIYTNFKRQVVIYDMMDTNIRFDKKILEAMIIGADKSLEKTLKLCMRFNCPSIADSFVFADPKYGNMDLTNIRAMFATALKENKWGFVDLFIENNFDVDSFITEDLLRDLYRVSFDPDKTQCAELLADLISNTEYYFPLKKKSRCYDPDILFNVDIAIKKLSGNLLDNRYKDFLSKKKDCAFDEAVLEDVDEDSQSEDDYHESTLSIQDLFLWSIISGRTDISLIMWKAGRDHIASALIASNILEKMAALVLVRGDNTLGAKLLNASENYQTLAVSIINEAYTRSKSKTNTLIVRQLKRWGNKTCLEIAINGAILNFLNHSACRSFTTKVWMGDLSPFLSTWKIILTIPLNLPMIKFIIIPSFPPKKLLKENQNKVKFQNKHLLPEKEKSPELNDLKKNSRSQIPFFTAMTIFYRAPIVKFYIHLLSYIAFLMIFTYLNLVELKPVEEVQVVKDVFAEIYVYVYVLTFIIEEIRQLIESDIIGMTYKIALYFRGTWNKFDALIILFFIISIVTRFTIIQHHFVLCRCLFAITLSMFYIRIMQFYFVNKTIGPKVIMIRDMLRDIFFFLSIFVIFLLAYGTLAQSLKSPNSELNLGLLKDIVYDPYFQTYGELMLDNFEKFGSCNRTNCIVKTGVIIGGFAIFLLLTNILLINLLIAMFGYTFNQIQDDSEKLWCFIRLQLVQEFYEKPIFPPPFNILYYAFRIITLPCKASCPKIILEQESGVLSQDLDNDKYFKMSIFEQLCFETVMIDLNDQKSMKTETAKNEKMTAEDLLQKINVKADLSAQIVPIESPLSFQARFDQRLNNIESQLRYKK